MNNASVNRCARITGAIAVYSRAAQKPVSQDLLIDMVSDILWYGREVHIDPATVCEQVINNDTRKEVPA